MKSLVQHSTLCPVLSHVHNLVIVLLLREHSIPSVPFYRYRSRLFPQLSTVRNPILVIVLLVLYVEACVNRMAIIRGGWSVDVDSGEAMSFLRLSEMSNAVSC